MNVRKLLGGTAIIALCMGGAARAADNVLITEFMAVNNGTLLDEDGASSDWIEVWNSTTATVNLTGYYLTDDAALPNKWALPSWTLGANNYLLVFASSKNRRPAQAVAGRLRQLILSSHDRNDFS